MWDQRLQSEKLLSSSLQVVRDSVETGLALGERIAEDLFEDRMPNRLPATAALILSKALLLCKGMYSLILEYIGQESGALLRPTIECFEILEYLRQDPSRVVEVLEDRLPKAGDIAKNIGSTFKPLREYLNEFASHLAIHPRSMRHLVDFSKGKLVFNPKVSPDVLTTNLKMLFVIIVLPTQVGIRILEEFSMLNPELLLAYQKWHSDGISTFGIVE